MILLTKFRLPGRGSTPWFIHLLSVCLGKPASIKDLRSVGDNMIDMEITLAIYFRNVKKLVDRPGETCFHIVTIAHRPRRVPGEQGADLTEVLVITAGRIDQ